MANWFMLNGVSDLVGQFPHDCCPTQRERVSVNLQSHAFSEDIHVLKTLHSTTIYFFLISGILKCFLYFCCSFYQL